MPIPLLERSPKEIAWIVKARIKVVKEVKDCSQVNVRVTGKRLDISGYCLTAALDLKRFIESSPRLREK